MDITEFDMSDTRIDRIETNSFEKHEGIGLEIQICTEDGRELKLYVMWSALGDISEALAPYTH